MMPADHTVAFDRDLFSTSGFAIRGSLFSTKDIEPLVAASERLFKEHSGRAGVRGVLDRSPECQRFVNSPAVRGIATGLLGPGAFVVRSILFDKTPDSNWDVVWHQDATIAVTQRFEVPGFGPWSVKQGVHHVQPPPPVLERMVTIRVHLDDCGRDNGPLLVVPGSHRSGLLSDQQVAVRDCEKRAVACEVLAGGVVVMRPLLLHASKKALQPGHRRVLHLEYAADPLPGGLEWARH